MTLFDSLGNATLREDAIIKPGIIPDIAECKDGCVFLSFIYHGHGFGGPDPVNLLYIANR